ncbi:hypothetical protein [Candidatus Endomicrobiellum trichonymphae]|uniref:hypothetical protein n=1 Tax=Endomicrobium trichonymphae TaxID=1408204 RepID=UPI000866005F|nr:hypothetical protein [Candidatus Endomicrobium trichonymphae]BAV59300.1 hypothetical protein RSTT_P1-001 [Candidatus Endomicrobium trichonymphae]
MKFKKVICVYLTLVLFLTGCGNLKSQIRGNQNTDASADQPTDNIIKSDNNGIIEKEETKELDDKLIGLDANGNGSSSQGENTEKETPSEEPELRWQDKAKKYADDAVHFLCEHKEQVYFVGIVVIYLLWKERLFQQQNHQDQMQWHLAQIQQQLQQAQDQIQQMPVQDQIQYLQQLQNHFLQAQFNLQQLNQDPNLIQQFQQVQDQIQNGIGQLQAQVQQQIQPQLAQLQLG